MNKTIIFANQFIKIEKSPAKVQIVNIKKALDKNSINDTIKMLQITTPNTPRPQ